MRFAAFVEGVKGQLHIKHPAMVAHRIRFPSETLRMLSEYIRIHLADRIRTGDEIEYKLIVQFGLFAVRSFVRWFVSVAFIR